MDRKTMLRDIGEKLRKFRESLKLKPVEMADRLQTYRTSYYKYEKGETSPQMTTLHKLGNTFGISMDWLILNRGPMHYKEIPAKEEVIKDHIPAPDISPTLEKDMKELLDHMERIPLLRHEVLVRFYKFKEEHKELL